MTKSDYIHLFKEACAGKCNAEYNPCAFRQAADSLAALKPVAWKEINTNHCYIDKDCCDDDDPIPLYDLNGWEK